MLICDSLTPSVRAFLKYTTVNFFEHKVIWAWIWINSNYHGFTIPSMINLMRFFPCLVLGISPFLIASCHGGSDRNNKSLDGYTISVYTDNFEVRFFTDNNRAVKGMFIFPKEGGVHTVFFEPGVVLPSLELYRNENLVGVGGNYSVHHNVPIVDTAKDVVTWRGEVFREISLSDVSNSD